jgi:energy-coupling factor transporter ATP-binding protein EcfA2
MHKTTAVSLQNISKVYKLYHKSTLLKIISGVLTPTSGTATVVVGSETRLVRPNESTYIKMGEVHRLENEGKIPVVLIEAQVGEYTGEDDIVRIEDDFKRDLE